MKVERASVEKMFRPTTMVFYPICSPNRKCWDGWYNAGGGSGGRKGYVKMRGCVFLLDGGVGESV